MQKEGITVLLKFWNVAKYILAFFITRFLSEEFMIIILAATNAEVTVTISRLLNDIPVVIGLLAVYGVYQLAKKSRNESEDAAADTSTNIENLIQESESVFAGIKEEISCWNWTIVTGCALSGIGIINLFTAFFYAVGFLIAGIIFIAIGIPDYKDRKITKELELKKKVMGYVAKTTPPDLPLHSDSDVKPALAERPSNTTSKSKTYKVAGVTFRSEQIKKLGIENEDYFKSKRGLIEAGLTDERVWKYEFYPETAELEPEPDNPEDPNAIKVLVDGEHVGYIKRGSCAHIRKILDNNEISNITCTIGGGPYKCVTEEYDEEQEDDVLILEKGETNFFVHLQITETSVVSESDTIPNDGQSKHTEPIYQETVDEDDGKKKTYCINCGREVGNNAYCPHCGQRTESDPWAAAARPSSSENHSEKNKWVAFLLCLFLGGIGAHRFYVGKFGTGILYLFTSGCLGIGSLIDLILILCGTFTDGDGLPLV